MKNSNINSAPLKEQGATLPVNAGGVMNKGVGSPKPAATFGSFGDNGLQFWGIVYRRWLDKPDCPDNGKSYVGETTDETTRKQAWNKPNSKEYAGAKILTARNTYGLLCWGYEVLEIVYAATKENLKKLLYVREAYYIEKYDSYENGFNGNRGGTGNTGVVFDEARRK